MKKKNVFIALKMSGISGQQKLAGVFGYLNSRYGEDHPWNIRLVRTRMELTEEAVRHALVDGTDGFIISIPDSSDALPPLARSGVPTVMMDIHSPLIDRRRDAIVSISNSADDIGKEAALHLLGRGVSRSYAFLHPRPVTDWSAKRFLAFKATLADAGSWCEELFDPDEVLKLRRPAAVLAANDDRAFELVKKLQAKKTKIPRDVAVLGVDNDVLICENSNPRISSVEPDFAEEGRLAAETLDRMMEGARDIPRTLIVGARKIVRRESTGELSSSGRLVQKAVSYIDRNALDGITVDDVVRHLGCSRRLADLRFRELQGKSILEAITERRLNEVKLLLAKSKEKIDTIALECGYKNPNYLKNLFKKRFKMTMSEFRGKSAL